uniref:Hypothetical chloroplast RF21 n=1 Tax=Mankyua chejuensis TaxID=996148 RepID=H8Y5Y8_9MONI|nr:hypothetical chloroplast RF21 [Mankyua chejuensis]ADZ47956.1 hypothetical chloroplast RF21 [Mankyua chejuensis]AJJ48586.1 Ycf2 [Mankyua chejuensis]
MEGESIQITSFAPPRIQNLRGITKIQSYLRFWTRLNIKEFFIRVFLNWGNILKLFDFRSLSSLILIDPRSLKNQNNTLLLKCLFFATIPIFFYCSKTGFLVKKEDPDLAELVNDSLERSAVGYKVVKKSNIDPSYLSKRVLSIYKKVLPIYSTVDSSVPEWWKDWIVRDILPSWGISLRLINQVVVLLRTKSTENLKNFFEFYIHSMPNEGYTTWRDDFDLCFVRAKNKKIGMYCSFGGQEKVLDNNLFSSAMIGFCKELLFETEDPFNKQKYESNIDFSNRYPYRFGIYSKRHYDIDLSNQPVMDYARYIMDFGARHEYRKRCWNLIQDFIEFYSWMYHLNNHFICSNYANELDIVRYIVKQRFVYFNEFDSSEHYVVQNVHSFLSDILYNFSIHLLLRVRMSESLKKFYSEKIGNIDLQIASDDARKVEKTRSILKDKDEKFSFPDSSASNRAKDLFWYFNHSKGSFFDNWDWKHFLTSIGLPISINDLNPGLYLSSIFSFVGYKIESSVKVGIAKFPVETSPLIDRKISNSSSSELVVSEVLKSLKYNHLDTLLAYNQFFIGKPEIPSLEKQRNISFTESFRLSEIDKIVDLYRIKKHSCYPYLKSYELIKNRFLLGRTMIKNDSFKHKSLFLPSNITFLFRSLFERSNIVLFQKYFRFKKLLTIGVNQINSLIIAPSLSPNETGINSTCESNQVILSRSDIGGFNKLEIYNTEYFNKEFLVSFIEDFLGIEKVTSWNFNNIIFTLWDTVRDDIFYLWNELKKKNGTYWISQLSRICQHDRLISTCLIDAMKVYKYFHLILVEIISKFLNQIDFWANNGGYNLAKYAIHQDSLIWWNSFNNQFNEFIGQTAWLCWDIRKALNQIQYLKLFPKSIPYRDRYINTYSSKELVNGLLLRKKLGEHYFSKNSIANKAFEIIVKSLKPFLHNSIGIVTHFINLIKNSSVELFRYNKNLLGYPQSRLAEESIVSFTHYAIPTNNIVFNLLYNENILTGSSYNPVYQSIDNKNSCLDYFHIPSNIAIKRYFEKINTLSFLDFLYSPKFGYNQRLYLIKKEIVIKGYNRIYKDFLLNSALNIGNKFTSFIRMKSLSLGICHTSSNESRLSNKVLSGYLDSVLRETDNLSYRLCLAKEFMSLTWTEFCYPEESGIYPFLKILMDRSSIVKRLVNIEMHDYWRPFLELEHEDFSIMKNGLAKGQSDQSELDNGPTNTEQSQNGLSSSRKVSSSNYIDSNKKVLDFTVWKKIIRLFFPTNSNRLREDINSHKKTRKIVFFYKLILLKNYNLWFFTTEWWKYVSDSFSEILPETLLNINDKLNSNVFNIVRAINNSLANSWLNLRDKLKVSFFNNSVLNSDSFSLREISGRKEYSLSRWVLLGFINEYSIYYSMFVTLLLLAYGTSRQYITTLVGFNSISLWKRSEILKYLMDFSQIFAAKGSTNSLFLGKQNAMKNLLISYSRRFLNCLTCISFYYPLGKEVSIWLSRRKNLDVSRENKNLVAQYLITNRSLFRYGFYPNYGFYLLSNNINGSIRNQGFNHLRHLTCMCHRDLLNYQLHKFDFLSKSILSAFRHNLNSPKIYGRFFSLVNAPISLQLGAFPGRGILLVGPTETGRSYLVKDLAANYRFPLIKIPIKRFLYNKPDFRNTPLILLSKKCLRRLDLTFELAKKMSPCMVWIQDIHELNFNSIINESEVDPKFLLHSLLRHLSNRSPNSCFVNNMVIASTHVPARVDPAIISPNRLDQLINIRMFTIHQHEKEFPTLLHAKGFQLKIDSFRSEELKSRIMGYSKRDLAILANEISLISITQNTSSICTDIIRLAFYRQGWALDNKSQSMPGYEMLLYKIGKTIIRNSFLTISHTDFLLVNKNFLKKRFYFLSNWYLEPPIAKSTVKKLTILPHIFECLAGAAARDSWFVLRNKQENSVFLDRVAENDLQLARGLLESLLVEFPWLDVRVDEFIKNALRFNTRNCLSMVQGCVSSKFSGNNRILDEKPRKKNSLSFEVNKLFGEAPCNLYRAPRIWRINFFRGRTYEFVRVPSELNPLYQSIILHQSQDRFIQSHLDSTQNKNERNEISKRRKERFIGYRRILKEMREKHTQSSEIQLNNLLFRKRIVKLQIDKSSVQYEMQYDSSNQPILFKGGRFIWDPTGLSLSRTNFSSPHDELFSGEETVRRLYIIYGIRRGRERHSSSNKYKKHLFHRGYNRNSITELFTDPWIKLPLAKKWNYEYMRVNQMMKSHLLTPQLFPTVYPYQGVFMGDTGSNYDHFRFSVHRHKWIEVNRFSFRDSFIYIMLLESYQYLLNFFLSNRKMLGAMMNALSKNKSISSRDIEEIFSDLKKIE